MAYYDQEICLKGKLYLGADFEGYPNIAAFQQNILNKLAAVREWVYNFDFHGTSVTPASSSPTLEELRQTDRYHDVTWTHMDKLDNEDKIFIRFYDVQHPQKKQRGDAVLFHWGKSNSFCLAYAFPVFYPDDTGMDGALYEHSYEHCSKSGLKMIYEYCESYSDSYDIHDHGHDEISAGFTYNAEQMRLYYYDPSVSGTVEKEME